MTQWKNLFSFEVSGECGALIVEGLAGSYGRARLRHVQRRPEGGEPNIEDTCFDEEDSFATEWAELVAAVLGAGRVESDAEDGVRTMRVVEALYRSARDGVATAP